MSATGPAKFVWRVYGLALLAIVVFALLPVASVFLTYLIAEANNCQVNEAYVQPCVVLGIDLGGLLYGMGVMGWLMLVTLPLGGGALIVWLVMLVIHYLAWWRLQKVDAP